MKNLAIGIFDLRVIVHRPGEVRATRKLKRLIDRRHLPDEPKAVREPEHAESRS